MGELSASARSAHDYLRAEGASFLGDLKSGLGLSDADAKAAVAELSLAGAGHQRHAGRVGGDHGPRNGDGWARQGFRLAP